MTIPNASGPHAAVPRLAIFDHDGVLVDSLLLHERAWIELGARTELPSITRGFVRETFGLTNTDIFRRIDDRRLDASEIARLGELKEAIYREIAAEHLQLMDGVASLIEGFREQGTTLAIGSSGPQANLQLTVEVCGLQGVFATIVGSEDVQRGKPDPQVFLEAARRTNIDPAQAVVFEDAPMGIRAAKSAGMTAIGVTSTHPTPILREAGADRIVASLEDLEVDRIGHLLIN